MNRLAILATMLLAGCAGANDTVHSTMAPGARYVAMGSSFAAGAGIGPTKPETPDRCQRTAVNYASLLAKRLNLVLDDQTCGGATTAHIIGPWNELPPQIDAVTPAVRLVTLTIGGNDLGYVGGLIAASCQTIRPAGPCAPAKQPSDVDYARVEASMREIARQVKIRAPRATLVFVQYVTLVPDRPCEAARLPADFAMAARAIGQRLAQITARVASEAGAMLVPADVLSSAHHPCSAEPWSIGMAPGFNPSLGAPWHPNRIGHQRIADALAASLGG